MQIGENVPPYFPPVQNPRMCLSHPCSWKVIRDEFLAGTRKMLLSCMSTGGVPSFREIGKAQGKQRGPWTIEGSLMYVVAREDGNPRVNAKWSNGKDKGRQQRWKQKWEAKLAGRGNGFANMCTHRTCWWRISDVVKDEADFACVRIYISPVYKNTSNIFSPKLFRRASKEQNNLFAKFSFNSDAFMQRNK